MVLDGKASPRSIPWRRPPQNGDALASLRPAITLALGLHCPEGKVIGGRAAIGCAFPMAITARLPITEPLLPRELVQKAAALGRDLTVLLPEPLTNRHASARYRRQMIEVL